MQLFLSTFLYFVKFYSSLFLLALADFYLKEYSSIAGRLQTVSLSVETKSIQNKQANACEVFHALYRNTVNTHTSER
jgi:hypothetical protein